MNHFSSVHAGAAEYDIVETLRVADLVESWRQDFKIDVARLFEGIETLHLVRDLETGVMRFDPPVLGDARFYQALRSFDWYHPATKEEFAAAAGWAHPGEPIIDIGAGDGGFAAHVPKEQYLGLETDPDAVAACRAKGLDIRSTSIEDILQQIGPGYAGLVTAFQVLEHVSDPSTFISDMVSLVRPGGRVAIGVPDAGSYVANLPDFMLNGPPHHLTWWTEASLESLMTRHGLTIRSVNRFEVE
ncbi:MAG: class I SAM-dependent methyltransferase, partial [Pseudomonadota bacterium]